MVSRRRQCCCRWGCFLLLASTVLRFASNQHNNILAFAPPSSVRMREETIHGSQILIRRVPLKELNKAKASCSRHDGLFASSNDKPDQGTNDETESSIADTAAMAENSSPSSRSETATPSVSPTSQSDIATSRGRILRKRVKALAKSVILRPLALATTVPMPSAIAAVLKEASLAAVEQVEEAINQRGENNGGKGSTSVYGRIATTDPSKEIINLIVEEAFAPMEASLLELEDSLQRARESLNTAKLQSYQAIEALQMAAVAQADATAERAASAVAQVEQQAQRQVMAEIYSNAVVGGTERVDLSSMTFDDVDYDSSEMAPPFLDPDSCLIPGEPVVRVERAPENSRRIFAGIDIMASVDDVWNVSEVDVQNGVGGSSITANLAVLNPLSIVSYTYCLKVLTNYAELQNVVPNLVVNEVLRLYEGTANINDSDSLYDTNAPVEIQCKQLSQHMKGSLLKQVGGAKVAGINFSARTTIEVREWPKGMPDFAHFTDDMWEGKSRDARANENPKTKLKRYRFPRPFALSSLPTRDISMQSIVDDDGEFRLYQGVWRMQPLPGCAPPGKQAMRLSYAVEISPRVYLPVQLVEGRIVRDLCTNLEAIRNAVSV